MAHPSFGVRGFQVLDRYEIRFGKDVQGFFLYEIEDLETFGIVDAKDGLTEEEFLRAIGCALDPFELLKFQQLVHSL